MAITDREKIVLKVTSIHPTYRKAQASYAQMSLR